MKKPLSVLIAFLLIINYSCKEKIDYEKEKKAIIAVLEEESASYYASDFDRWSATQIQDSTNIRMSATKSGYGITSGWESISQNMKPTIVNKRQAVKEVKTPLRIKIYEESAWIVFNNESFNDKGESTGITIVTNFLEKHDGIWKMVYRNFTAASSYTQSDIMLINSINYAKSLGKSVEDLASFSGDQIKTSWNQANGFNGLVNGMLNNWRPLVPIGELKILERDDNHIIFSASKMFTGLKTSPQYNVTYDDYLTFFRVACEKIADYMGGIYKQETTPDGVLVTIIKK